MIHEVEGALVVFKWKICVALALVLCSLVAVPLHAQSSENTSLDSTIYQFDKAWIEIMSTPTLPSQSTTDQIFDSATLFIRHIHKSNRVERLIYIPVSLHVHRNHPKTSLRIGAYKLVDLKGQSLSTLFGPVLSLAGTGFHRSVMSVTMEPGFIDPDDKGFAYIIYSDRQQVDAVPLGSLLELRL